VKLYVIGEIPVKWYLLNKLFKVMQYNYCIVTNSGVPSSKAKYVFMCDSVQVLWRKGEIDTEAGVKRGKIIN